VPVPPLELTGLLPAGVHDATVDEIRLTFGSANDTRIAIMDGLTKFVAIVRTFSIFKEFFVDGSFVTQEPVPKDVDVVLLFEANEFGAFATSPHAKKLVDRAAFKNEYKVDLLLGPRAVDMPQFFQGLRAERALELGLATSHRKGILRVTV
jgi:hypothetical protein